MTRKRRSLVAALAAGTFAVISYVGCSREVSRISFQQGQSINVSTSCGNTQKVSHEELFKMIEQAHSPGDGEQRVRCPGFFAVIDDELETEAGTLEQAPLGMGLEKKKAGLSPAKRQSLIAEANNCNRNGPGTPVPPPSEGVNKDTLIRGLLGKTDSSRILGWIKAMSDKSLWNTRYHQASSGRKVPQWIMEEMKKIAGNRSDISIRLVEHVNTPQPSVEAIIQGTGPNKDKFVVVGGHEDSIHGTKSKTNADATAPGADDNASGVATVLEAFRVLVESGLKPDASLAFFAYAAEEVGLVGSQEIAKSYANAAKQVLGVMQIDMSSYSSAVSASSMDEIMFITDYTSDTLTKTAAQLAQQYLGLKVSYDKCGYGCSDHASWNKYNYHAIMPAEKEVWTSVDQRIHTEKDAVDSQVKPEYAEKFAKLAIAFGISLAF